MNLEAKNDTNHEYQDSNDSASTPEREKLEPTTWNPASKPLSGSKANSYEYSSPYKLAAWFNASNERSAIPFSVLQCDYCNRGHQDKVDQYWIAGK